MKKTPFSHRLAGSMIDFTMLFSAYTIAAFAISYFYFLTLIPGFLIVWLLYYLCCYLYRGTTFGISFFDGYTECRGDKPSRPRLLLWILLSSLPALSLIVYAVGFDLLPYLGRKMMDETTVLLVRLYLFLLFLPLGLIVILLFRKIIFKIRFVSNKNDTDGLDKYYSSRRSFLLIYILLLVGSVTAQCLNTILTNKSEFISANGILWTTPRPTANSVKKYTSYLKDNRQDIKEYIFDLFEDYDHVIIGERFHPEMTQYEFICDLIDDDRFLDNVGTVFTEIGNSASIESFQRLLDTPFQADSLLEKALATFLIKENQSYGILWEKTNWFYFLKHVYYLRQKSGKDINISFTNRATYMHTLNPDSLRVADSTYDPLMADHIIRTIQTDSLKKSLIIMNTRHSFMIDGLDSGNCGRYVADAFPGRVANVMVHTPTLYYFIQFLFPLIHKGKWDVAFEEIPEKSFAFDLKNSTFGDDKFDLHPFFFPISTFKYQEVYNGFIYYLPLYEHKHSSGYPYMMDGENADIFLSMAEETGYNLDMIKHGWIPHYKDIEKGKIAPNRFFYFGINLLSNIIFSIVMVIGIITSLMMWFRLRRLKKTK